MICRCAGRSCGLTENFKSCYFIRYGQNNLLVYKIASFTERNPVAITRQIGQRLRGIRLAKGWTQQELAERSGLALSTLKLLENKGWGSFQRLVRVAVTLGIDGELRDLFAKPSVMESIAAVKRSERQRAPRREKKKEQSGI
jgi:transcriptional regulator with XRE-family HTH domain